MQNIKNVIFDLGGVILNIDVKKTAAAFTSLGHESFENLFNIGHAAGFFKEYECGIIDDAGFIAAIKERFQQNVTDIQIIDAWNALLLDFPGSRIEFLKSIGSKYRLFLFSNTNALHREAFNIIYQNTFKNGHLDELFEKAYYSHILRMRKPDPASFQYIINENGLNPAETLFVDDALVNIEGAQKCGIQTFHLVAPATIQDIGL
jgi:putative hydrolase of the HAD superfamily